MSFKFVASFWMSVVEFRVILSCINHVTMIENVTVFLTSQNERSEYYNI